MPTTKPIPLSEDDSSAPTPAVILERHVLATLGRPPEFLRVSVNRLWTNTYRANVLVGPSLGTARCAHSYFVEMSDVGTVAASTPPLVREYPRPVPPTAG